MFLSNSVAMLESIRNGQQMALTCGPSACSMWALNNGNWNSNHLSYKLIINNTTESRVGNTFLYLKGESNAGWLQHSRSPGECLKVQRNYAENGCVTLSVEALLKIPAAFAQDLCSNKRWSFKCAYLCSGSFVCGALDPLLTCAALFWILSIVARWASWDDTDAIYE